jgi:glycosyltransferase involved in cell wall biosynthesis
MELVGKKSKDFDIIHSHIDYLFFPFIRRSRVPHLTTLHGRLDLPDLQPLYREYPEIPLVSISDSQRGPLPFVNWKATVYHGLPLNLYRFNPVSGNYFAFVGRISPEKRVDRAIEIARRSGVRLLIAAKIDKVDREYYETCIRKLMDDPLIEFVGEIGEKEKNELLGNAMALIYPVGWPEPFGLAMIESMACGTPVIAYNNGSVPEVIDENVTGFVVSSVSEALKAVQKVPFLDRGKCRERFEKRFSSKRMADDYVKIYSSMVNQLVPADIDIEKNF